VIKLQPYRNVRLNYWTDKSVSINNLIKMCGTWPKEDFDYYMKKRVELSMQSENALDFFELSKKNIKNFLQKNNINTSDIKYLTQITKKILNYVRHNNFSKNDFLQNLDHQIYSITIPFINKHFLNANKKNTSKISDNPLNHKRYNVMKFIGMPTASDFHKEKEYHKKFIRPDFKSLLLQKNKFLEQFSRLIENSNYQSEFRYSKREIQKLRSLVKKYDAVNNALLMNKINTYSIDSLIFSRLDFNLTPGDILPNNDIVIKCSNIYDCELKKYISTIVTFANTNDGVRFKMYRNDRNFLDYIPKLKKQYKYFIRTGNIDGINALNKKCIEVIKDYEIGEVFVDINNRWAMQNKMKESGIFSDDKIDNILANGKCFYYIHNLKNFNSKKYYNISSELINCLKEFGAVNNIYRVFLEALAYGDTKHSPIALYLHAGCKPISENLEDIEKDIYNHNGYDYTKNVWLEYKI